MNDLTTREPANDPQDLERLLVARENAGDVTGMTALFEPDAVVDIGGGTFLRGKEAIHEFFTELQVTGFGPEKRKFEFGEQRPALICGDLALTSTRGAPGWQTVPARQEHAVTAQNRDRQPGDLLASHLGLGELVDGVR